MTHRRQAWIADGLLLLTAVIWGSGFVAQRDASGHLGPLTFNAVRNVIAALALLPVVLRWGQGDGGSGLRGPQAWIGGAATGLALFAGGWLQQAGIAHTTAGNAGFITGLYVVLVPIVARLRGQRVHVFTWPAAGLAAAGLYLLSVTGAWALGRGDALVLASAGFWTAHVLLIGHFAPRMNGLWLAWLQVVFASLFSIPAALVMEPVSWAAIRMAALPVLYAGVVCGGLAFTLQIIGQRHAPPSHAAVLMSLESVFAAVFGALLLGERLGPRGLAGAGLMFAGMLVSQWPQFRRRAV